VSEFAWRYTRMGVGAREISFWTGLRLRVQISTASGSERGLLKQPLAGATLATARGTDPAIPYTQLRTDLVALLFISRLAKSNHTKLGQWHCHRDTEKNCGKTKTERLPHDSLCVSAAKSGAPISVMLI